VPDVQGEMTKERERESIIILFDVLNFESNISLL
jgi:hypothetical protein